MSDPLHQFVIRKQWPISLFGVDISLTNSAIFMLLTLGIVVVLSYLGVRRRENASAEALSVTETLSEMMFRFVANLVKDNCGDAGRRYLPFVMSFFLLVAGGNVLGMFPYTFTFTSHIIVTFVLAAIVFCTVTLIGFFQHGAGYLKIFLPGGAPLFLAPILIPIEMISYLSRPISLSVRLFANVMAGHMVMKIFAGFVVALGVVGGWIPLAMTVLITFFEVFVALVQAYIFAILTCVYLNDALHLH